MGGRSEQAHQKADLISPIIYLFDQIEPSSSKLGTNTFLTQFMRTQRLVKIGRIQLFHRFGANR